MPEKSVRFNWQYYFTIILTVLRRTSDCGKLQVTGEVIHSKMYRINATFIAERFEFISK